MDGEKLLEDCLFSVEENTILDKRNNCSFVFDSVYDGGCSTIQLYDEYVKQIVDGAIEGFHGTIFAYGQTGSGKTYTISGTKNSDGVIPLAITQIFNHISLASSLRQYLLRVSYFEIYCEKITDLLSDGKDFLDVREDQNREPYVEGLHEEIVSSEEHALSLLQKGTVKRRTGATAMNNKSSRSHAVFRLIVESKQTDGVITMSHLNLVDLAGSEKVNQTKAEGQRFREGVEINLSLSTLNMVIKQITENQTHVNYRGSKLTRILKNSIGGNAKTCIICTISPWDYEQSLSTLRFATNAKKIENRARKNEIVPEVAMLKRREAEIKQLESEIIEVRRENEKLKSYNNNNTDVDELQKKLEELKLQILRGSNKGQNETKSRVEILKDRRMTWAPSRISSNCFSLSPIPPLMKTPRPPIEFAPQPLNEVPLGSKNFGKKVQFNCLPSVELDEMFMSEQDSVLQCPEKEQFPIGNDAHDREVLEQYTPLEQIVERGTPARAKQKLHEARCTPLKTIQEQRTPKSARRPSDFASTPYLIKQSKHVRQLVETTRSFFEKHRQLAESELNEMCEGLEFHFMESLVYNTVPKAHLFSPDVANVGCVSDENLINFDETFSQAYTIQPEVNPKTDECISAIMSPLKMRPRENDYSTLGFPPTVTCVDQEVQTDEISENLPNVEDEQGRVPTSEVAVNTELFLHSVAAVAVELRESDANECKTAELPGEILSVVSEKHNLSSEKNAEKERSEEIIPLQEQVESLTNEIAIKDLQLAASERRVKEFEGIVSQQEQIEKLNEEKYKKQVGELQRQCEEDFEMINVSHKEQAELHQLLEKVVLEKETLEERMSAKIERLLNEYHESQRKWTEERESLVQQVAEKQNFEDVLEMKEKLGASEDLKQKFEKELKELQQKLEEREEIDRKAEKKREEMDQNLMKEREEMKQKFELIEEAQLRIENEREEMKQKREELEEKLRLEFEFQREEMKKKFEEQCLAMKQNLEEERAKLNMKQIDEMSTQLAAAREENSVLEGMLEDAGKLYADTEAKVEQLTAELETMEKIREKNKSLEQSVKVLQEKDKEADKTLKRCIQTVLDEKAVLQKSLDSARKRQFDMIAAGKKELREENDKLKKQLQLLEMKVPKLEKQLDEKTEKCWELERRMPMGPFTQMECETFEDLKKRYYESHEHYVRKKRECINLKQLKEEQEKEIAELKEKLDKKFSLDLLDSLEADMDSSQILVATSSNNSNTGSSLTVKNQATFSSVEERAPSRIELQFTSADVSFLN